MTTKATLALLFCVSLPAVGCGASSGDDPEPNDGATDEASFESADRVNEESADGDRDDGDDADGADDAAAEAALDFPAPEDVAAPPPDAMVRRSGLASKVIEPGTGTRHPRENERVRVDYNGWHTDGTLFDSSLRGGAPAVFPLDGVIEGWTEGLQLMVVGEHRRFWIPEDLAYKGDEDKPSGMLVFDVWLLEIVGI